MRTCPECGALTELTTCRGDGCPTIPVTDPSRPQPPEIGQLVAGKFRILNVIGRGGMAVVYRAWQRDMRRVVALKLCNSDANDAAGTRRFLREVQMAAGLVHPNTIRIFDYGEAEPGRPFFTMEYLDGEPLGRAIRRGELFDDLRVARIAEQILGALSEAHAAGIVHRDLSPDNIFLMHLTGKPDYVKVLDFGVAKGARYDLPEEERLTVQGMFVGKPAYASPEQAEGIEELDGRSDLYTLGIVMYQMITGNVPFTSATPMQVLVAQIRDKPRPIEEAARRPVDPELAAFIMKLLSKRREDRPASALAALAELERISRRLMEPHQAPAKAIPAPPVQRRGARFLLSLAVALVATGLGAALTYGVVSTLWPETVQESEPATQVQEETPQKSQPATEVPKPPEPGPKAVSNETPAVAPPAAGSPAVQAPPIQAGPVGPPAANTKTPRKAPKTTGKRPNSRWTF